MQRTHDPLALKGFAGAELLTAGHEAGHFLFREHKFESALLSEFLEFFDGGAGLELVLEAVGGFVDGEAGKGWCGLGRGHGEILVCGSWCQLKNGFAKPRTAWLQW